MKDPIEMLESMFNRLFNRIFRGNGPEDSNSEELANKPVDFSKAWKNIPEPELPAKPERNVEEPLATERQKQFIHRLGGCVRDDMTASEASALIEQLWSEPDRLQAARDEYKKEEAATWAQIVKIERLGGRVVSGMSKYDASKMIERLQQDGWRVRREERLFQELGWPMTPRQRMAFRFWNEPEKANKREATAHMDAWYATEPIRKEAWELWKKENPEANASNDPSRVPVGAGPEYIEKIKAAQILKKQKTIEKLLKEVDKETRKRFRQSKVGGVVLLKVDAARDAQVRDALVKAEMSNSSLGVLIRRYEAALIAFEQGGVTKFVNLEKVLQVFPVNGNKPTA